MSFLYRRSLVLIIVCLIGLFARAREAVILQDISAPIEQREALLVLPGFNKVFKGTASLEKYFAGRGLDLFIFDFKYNNSISENGERLKAFYKKNNLASYAGVHVLNFIVGAWIFNSVASDLPSNNIKTIIYDRSPLQESIPKVIRSSLSRKAIEIIFSGLQADFFFTPYAPVNWQTAKIGLIIENRPTRMAHSVENKIRALGPIEFSPSQFGQRFDDYIEVWFNHDQMYDQIERIGHEILHFIARGRFREDARRIPYDGDHFDRDVQEPQLIDEAL